MPSRSRPPLALPLVVLAACAHAPQGPRPQVDLVVYGPDELLRDARHMQRSEAVAVRFRVQAPPLRVGGSGGGERLEADVATRLAGAREAYLEGELERCVALLSGEDTLVALIAEGRRGAAARWLFWRAACHVAAGRLEEAARVASSFAALGLSVPTDADQASVEVEQLLARALQESARRPRVALEVHSTPPGAELRLDGRPAPCLSPCRLEVVPGRHVLQLRRTGYVPVVRTVSLGDEPKTVRIDLDEAPPSLAARQWRRLAASERADLESALALGLLARALNTRRLLWVRSTGQDSRYSELRFALLVDGAVRARTTRAPTGGASGPEVLEEATRDLLLRGRVLERVPLTREPMFWVAVAGALVVAAGTTFLLLHEPDVRVQLRLPGEPPADPAPSVPDAP